jgi:hypothetical protein
MLHSPAGFPEKHDLNRALDRAEMERPAHQRQARSWKPKNQRATSYILVVVEVVEVLVVFFAFVFLALVVVVSVSAKAATVPNVKPANTRAATIFFMVNLS